jgi:ATP/ADP translocase
VITEKEATKMRIVIKPGGAVIIAGIVAAIAMVVIVNIWWINRNIDANRPQPALLELAERGRKRRESEEKASLSASKSTTPVSASKPVSKP